MPRGRNAPNDCPAEPGERDVDRAVGQPLPAVAPGDLVPEHRADGAVDVADRQLQPDRLAVAQRALAQRDQRVVERLLQAVVLPRVWCARRRLGTRAPQDRREVEPDGLPVLDRLGGVEHLDVADRLVERAEAEGGELLAHLLGDVLEERHDELRLAR